MAKRKKRRRGGRRRNESRTGLILGLVIALVAIIGGAVAYSKGVFDGLTSDDSATSSEGVSASSSRLHGAEGIDVGAVTPPAYWWVGVSEEVWGQITVDTLPTDSVPVGSDSSVVPQATDRYERVLVPADLLFDANSAVLSAKAAEGVKSIASTVKDPSLRMVVVCHSSADGDPAARQPLSEQRADALASALEQLLGRAAGSIERIGKGDSEPLEGIDQSTASGRALNRRCEVYLQFG